MNTAFTKINKGKSPLTIVGWLLAVIVLIWLLLPLIPRRNPPLPDWKQQDVLARVPQLRPGMTEPKVWATLGLTWWGYMAFPPGSYSGNPRCLPVRYQIGTGRYIYLAWDRHYEPPVLVRAYSDDMLNKGDG